MTGTDSKQHELYSRFHNLVGPLYYSLFGTTHFWLGFLGLPSKSKFVFPTGAIRLGDGQTRTEPIRSREDGREQIKKRLSTGFFGLYLILSLPKTLTDSSWELQLGTEGINSFESQEETKVATRTGPGIWEASGYSTVREREGPAQLDRPRLSLLSFSLLSSCFLRPLFPRCSLLPYLLLILIPLLLLLLLLLLLVPSTASCTSKCPFSQVLYKQKNRIISVSSSSPSQPPVLSPLLRFFFRSVCVLKPSHPQNLPLHPGLFAHCCYWLTLCLAGRTWAYMRRPRWRRSQRPEPAKGGVHADRSAVHPEWLERLGETRRRRQKWSINRMVLYTVGTAAGQGWESWPIASSSPCFRLPSPPQRGKTLATLLCVPVRECL